MRHGAIARLFSLTPSDLVAQDDHVLDVAVNPIIPYDYTRTTLPNTIKLPVSLLINKDVAIRSEFIECFENNCREQEIECIGSDGQCTFDCINDLSCFNSKLVCADDATCHITCNGQYSCLFSTLQCPNNGDCFINGVSINSMSSTYIYCPTLNDSKCNVNCDSTLSCQHVLIDGRSAGEVKMDCNEFNACWDMKVYCPPYSTLDGTKQCIISGMLCILALFCKTNGH